MKLFLVVAICVASTTVRADFYKCKTANGNVYSEKPCAQNELGQKIDVAGGANSVEESRERLAKEKQLVRKIEAIRNGEVVIGMTKDEVLNSWGTPSKINRSAGVGYSSEQWVYNRGGSIGREQYLYIENGVLKSFQSPSE